MVFDEINAGIGERRRTASGPLRHLPNSRGRDDHPPPAYPECPPSCIPREKIFAATDRHAQQVSSTCPSGAKAAADARGRRVLVERQMSFVELHRARRIWTGALESRKRLSADDIAIIDDTDRDRVSAERSSNPGTRRGHVASGHPAVFQIRTACARTRRPSACDRDGGRSRPNTLRGELFDRTRRGPLYRNGTCLAQDCGPHAREPNGCSRTARQVTDALEAFAETDALPP